MRLTFCILGWFHPFSRRRWHCRGWQGWKWIPLGHSWTVCPRYFVLFDPWCQLLWIEWQEWPKRKIINEDLYQRDHWKTEIKLTDFDRDEEMPMIWFCEVTLEASVQRDAAWRQPALGLFARISVHQSFMNSVASCLITLSWNLPTVSFKNFSSTMAMPFSRDHDLVTLKLTKYFLDFGPKSNIYGWMYSKALTASLQMAASLMSSILMELPSYLSRITLDAWARLMFFNQLATLWILSRLPRSLVLTRSIS